MWLAELAQAPEGNSDGDAGWAASIKEVGENGGGGDGGNTEGRTPTQTHILTRLRA
jgi:hypothetical protein